MAVGSKRDPPKNKSAKRQKEEAVGTLQVTPRSDKASSAIFYQAKQPQSHRFKSGAKEVLSVGRMVRSHFERGYGIEVIAWPFLESTICHSLSTNTTRANLPLREEITVMY